MTSVPTGTITSGEFARVVARLLAGDALRRRLGLPPAPAADAGTHTLGAQMQSPVASLSQRHARSRAPTPSADVGTLPAVAIAVDGSAASMALCVLLRDLCLATDRGGGGGSGGSSGLRPFVTKRLVGLTVDPIGTNESAEAAARIAAAVRGLGMEHRTIHVNWSEAGSGVVGDDEDPPVPTGMAHPGSISLGTSSSEQPGSVRKRASRHLMARKYNSLARAAKQENAPVLFLAHSLERLVARSLNRFANPDRHAWATDAVAYNYVDSEIPHAHAPGALHTCAIRPLIGISEDRLKATCDSAGISWATVADNPFSSPRTLQERRKLDKVLELGAASEGNDRITFQELTEHVLELSRHAIDIEGRGATFLNVGFRTLKMYNDHWFSDPSVANLALAHLHRWCTGSTEFPTYSIVNGLRARIVASQIGFRLQKDWPRSLDRAAPSVGSEKAPASRTASHGSGMCTALPPRPAHTGSDNWVLARSPISRRAMDAAEAPLPAQRAVAAAAVAATAPAGTNVTKDTAEAAPANERSRVERHGTSARVFLRVGQVGLWDRRFYVSVTLTADAWGERAGRPLLRSVDPARLLFVARPFTEADYRSLRDRLQARMHGAGAKAAAKSAAAKAGDGPAGAAAAAARAAAAAVEGA
ncbi:hypothetical protein HK405_011525 [Cladochytrium tenue]|nr:hypothetical protein HK405_011525 [Cladochytrium tenue]